MAVRIESCRIRHAPGRKANAFGFRGCVFQVAGLLQVNGCQTSFKSNGHIRFAALRGCSKDDPRGSISCRLNFRLSAQALRGELLYIYAVLVFAGVLELPSPQWRQRSAAGECLGLSESLTEGRANGRKTFILRVASASSSNFPSRKVLFACAPGFRACNPVK